MSELNNKQTQFLPGRLLATTALALSLTGCLGTVVGSAVDVTLEVAKVPFKVAGAVVDVASGDDEKDDKDRD
ncbi:NF038104 family lipoprotein [Pseudohongiella spirulinae]|uniref:Lipoprotein n=1 Tax=Pseudohongiella spirulinae TaxID=1249552 RepID=A0A0S2KBC7_9GAMM|nr:NF038104 family lipoprotein [Pseudohongiella spirulinae]ALO45461.1 hypothetical protein PS2015_785 [Pseudohongiella spirulinae]